MRRIIVIALALSLMLASIGCSNWKNRDRGALIGAGAGAAAGAVIGDAAGNTALGAILGAVVGGAAGAYIGNQMDKQAAELKADLDGATIERVGEGIKITFNSGILFDVNSSQMRSEAVTNLQKLSSILNKYPDTEVLIEGHTDSDGTEEHNMDLSNRRSQSVANTMEAASVTANRFIIRAYGETQPVGDNATADGKQKNRRVEIAIYANDKLKNAAKKQMGN